MSTFDYTSLKGDVDELLAEFGSLCRIKQVQNPVVDAVNGTVTGTEVDQDVLTAIVAYDEKLVDNTTIRRGDRQAIVQATIDITTGGTITDLQGKTWNIVDCEAVCPAETTLVYILQLRR